MQPTRGEPVPAVERREPYVHVTWLAKVMDGAACQWACAFQIGHQLRTRAREFNNPEWNVAHTRALVELENEIRGQEPVPDVEYELSVRVGSATISGKIDCLVADDDRRIVTIHEVKTGSPKSRDKLQTPAIHALPGPARPHLPRVRSARPARLAVARRASAGTFVVIQDGIDAVRPEEADKWPPSYIEGLVAGLFLDRDGYLDLKAWKVREAARLLSSMPDPLQSLHRLVDETTNAAWSSKVVSDNEVRQETIDELEATALLLPAGEPRELWLKFAQRLRSAEVNESG